MRNPHVSKDPQHAGELIVPFTFTKKGSHIMSFESDRKPVFVHVNPFHRVPQTTIENCTWLLEEARQHKDRSDEYIGEKSN